MSVKFGLLTRLYGCSEPRRTALTSTKFNRYSAANNVEGTVQMYTCYFEIRERRRFQDTYATHVQFVAHVANPWLPVNWLYYTLQIQPPIKSRYSTPSHQTTKGNDATNV